MMQFAVGLQYIIILGFSRACLGKIIIFIYEWLKKTVFHHVDGRFGKSNQQCHRDLLSNFKNGFKKANPGKENLFSNTEWRRPLGCD